MLSEAVDLNMASSQAGCDLDEDDSGSQVCIGSTCFAKPHTLYIPPAFYGPLPVQEYRWKLGAKVSFVGGVHLKLQRLLALPNCLGLGDDGRWRWQWYPLSLVLGLNMDALVEQDWSRNFVLSPSARLKPVVPLCGKLALRPALDILPVPCFSLKRSFGVGSAKLTLQGSLELNSSGVMKGPRLQVKLNWERGNSAKAAFLPHQESLPVRYSKRFKIASGCTAVATGLAEASSNVFRLPCGSLPVGVKLDSVEVSQTVGKRVPRRTPAALSTYVKASESIGSRDSICVVPGHWIDPGYEIGAPGERQFNLEVANVLEKKLHRSGWHVLRPDRDAPCLSWEEYLNWVSKQTLKGTPVLEIHGQGPTADYRGLVLGVIGDANAPLGRELAKDFGVFEMDWTDLAIPRRGGVVLESFNSDEVLQMSPWHRTSAVRKLSNQIAAAIERASCKNRAARSIQVGLGSQEL